MKHTNLRWLWPGALALCLLLTWLPQPGLAAAEQTRPAWDAVEQPFISAVRDLEDGQLEVDILGVVGEAGGDELVVTMYDKGGEARIRQTTTVEKDRHTLVFTPETPGNYSFQAELRREGEMPKASASVSVAFGLPLGKPVILDAAGQADGTVQLRWTAVEEATGYEVLVNGTSLDCVYATAYTATGLPLGQSCTFQVVALRGSERTVSDGVTVIAGAHTEHTYSQEWYAEDAQFHWYACVCGDRKDSAAHSFQWVVDREATREETGLQHQVCRICGYALPPEEIPAVAGDQSGTEGPGVVLLAAVALGVLAAAAWLLWKRSGPRPPAKKASL